MIKLTLINDTSVYINPKNIEYMMYVEDDNAMTLYMTSGMELSVEEDASRIVSIINTVTR